MDFSRLRQGEIVAGIGGIALFVFLFFDWFNNTNGWTALGGSEFGDATGFIVALASIAGIGLAALAAAGKAINSPLPRGQITLLVGSLAILVILFKMISLPEQGEYEFGVFLGLAAAVAIAVGALLALREDGWEPLVSDGGATRSRGIATTRRAASSGSTTRKPAATTRSRKKAPAKKRAAKRSARS